jgi:replicative DNA helicase
VTTAILPHSIEAERTVLGSLFLSGQAIDEVAPVLSAPDFFHPGHSAIYAASLSLSAASLPVTPISVGEKMRADGTAHALAAMGGEAYFSELMTAVVTVENVGYHAKIIASKALRRRVMEAAREVAQQGFEPTTDDAEFVEAAEVGMLAALVRKHDRGPLHVRGGFKALSGALERRRDAPGGVIGVPTGLVDLDALLHGLRGSTLTVVAGRPGMGKSALAAQLALHAAVECKIPVLFVSLEMEGVNAEEGGELIERLAAAHGRVKGESMKSGKLTPGDWMRLTRASTEIATSPIWIDDEPGQSMVKIRSKVRRWRAREGAGDGMALILVDYIQLIHGERANREANREQEIAEISRALKELAKELRCPVVALAQLNREPDKRTNHRPMLSDLRESGAIEQDADVVAFLYRDEFYNRQSDKRGVAEVIIAKHRSGATGAVEVAWQEEFCRFEDLSRREETPRYGD